jgi:hypothetical protein
MQKVDRLPWSVRAMAWLLACYGVLDISVFLYEFFVPGGVDNYSYIIFGLIKINMGAGILERSRFWRFVILAWLACSYTSTMIILIFALFFPSPNATWGFKLGPAFSENFSLDLSDTRVSFFIIAFLVINTAWVGLQWWALDRPEVRKLFIKSSEEPELSKSTSAL